MVASLLGERVKSSAPKTKSRRKFLITLGTGVGEAIVAAGD